MLSKVAERVYWTARYLERIESTARLLSIYDKLLFDIPRSVKLSWYNLIIINSLTEQFNERYAVRDERNVVKFMIGDEDNPSSIVSSLHAIRENVRTTRDVVPADVWRLINELSLYVQGNLKQGINRSQRYEFLEEVIGGCQQILGLLYSDMPRDEAWDFLRLGRNLERADMTSRNIDAAMATVLQTEDDEHALNSRQIIWLNLLRSLNADHSFRRSVRDAVSGSTVVHYLLENKMFPKSVRYSFTAMTEACAELPQAAEFMPYLQSVETRIFQRFAECELGESLRDALNELQLAHQQLHRKICELWFPVLN